MDDTQIVELYWARKESAIEETAAKYGSYCHSIALNILHNPEDATESVNDTWLDAWNSMPPHRPSVLSTFLGKLTRRISIDKWRRTTAKKRGNGQLPLVLAELEDCISDGKSIEEETERKLAHTQDNLLRVNDKIEELSLQVSLVSWISQEALEVLLRVSEVVRSETPHIHGDHGVGGNVCPCGAVIFGKVYRHVFSGFGVIVVYE